MSIALSAARVAAKAVQHNNAFDAVKYKLQAGQGAVIQVWGDSTTLDSSNGPPLNTGDRRYVGQWADQLVSTGRLDAACCEERPQVTCEVQRMRSDVVVEPVSLDGHGATAHRSRVDHHHARACLGGDQAGDEAGDPTADHGDVVVRWI